MMIRRERAAFTLIELLVVIAIIAILIALLVPAVQKVREAAARAQCQNNLKQMGLALHGYHDIYKRLPPGTSQDQVPFGPGPAGGWGTNWMVYILPYIEQSTLFDKIIFNSGQGSGYGNNANGALYANVKIPIYRCPSSPLPDLCVSGVPGSGGGTTLLSSYVGIAGAVNGIVPGYTETRAYQTTSGSTGCCSGGILSFGGPLPPNGKLTLLGLTDGTSNTVMVSEHSDFITTVDGSKRAWTAGGPHGWTIGWGNQNTGSSSPGGDLRAFNVTTVRYGVNQKVGWTNSPGNCTGQGICDNTGQNIPLNSAHTGGVNALLGDGTVRFLADSITIDVLGRLATRDDGQTVNIN